MCIAHTAQGLLITSSRGYLPQQLYTTQAVIRSGRRRDEALFAGCTGTVRGSKMRFLIVGCLVCCKLRVSCRLALDYYANEKLSMTATASYLSENNNQTSDFVPN